MCIYTYEHQELGVVCNVVYQGVPRCTKVYLGVPSDFVYLVMCVCVCAYTSGTRCGVRLCVPSYGQHIGRPLASACHGVCVCVRVYVCVCVRVPRCIAHLCFKY